MWVEDSRGELVNSAQAQGKMRTWPSLAAHCTCPTDACKEMWWPFVRSFRPRVPYTDGGLER